jgi:hypothetical protein
MTPAESRRLQAYQAKLRRLAGELTDVGFISSGSVVRRFMPCGKPGCRCQADPPQLHGPYWQWTRAVGGKTVTRRLSEDQARLYQEWIGNRRRLTKMLAEMEKVSQQAASILLRTNGTAAPTDDAGHARGNAAEDPAAATTLRVTRQLAEALVQVSELMGPVAEAAQQWLDAKDEGDRDLVAEARQDLEAAMAESGDLPTAIEGLAQMTSTARAAQLSARRRHRSTAP